MGEGGGMFCNSSKLKRIIESLRDWGGGGGGGEEIVGAKRDAIIHAKKGLIGN